MLSKFINGRVIDYLLVTAVLMIFSLAMLSGLPRLRSDTSIRIATALLPPQMGQDGRGREAEIIEMALRAGGVTTPIEYHVLPFTRHWQSFKADTRFQAVTTVPDDLDLDGLRSNVYIRYRNGIIYKLSTFPMGLGASPLETLVAKRVVAFAGASAILPGVRELSDRSAMYLERKDQISHSAMLSSDIVDAVIAEELIFSNYTNELLGNAFNGFARTAAFDPVFCGTPYSMVFRDDKLRDSFNKGLGIIDGNGALKRIEHKYAGGARLHRVNRKIEGCLK
ncbi:MAG: hypothetical protein ABL901_07735 [Hyphomicrobiaceae bacterium]